MAAHLNEIFNKSLSDQVLDALRAAILDGDLRPGTSLVETDLAAQLGVSRAPLREALRILSAEGLVDMLPYHSTKVRALSRRDIEEIYSLRAELETFAVQQLMRVGMLDAAEQLQLHENAVLLAAQSGDLKQVNEADSAFHRTLVMLSGHSLLLTTWDSLAMRVRQVLALLNHSNLDLTPLSFSHVAILATLARGDEVQAVVEIQQHVMTTGRWMAAHWDDSGQESP